ncbi:hypothetical protein JCM8097_001921 [Rhodosporidiobolus ruineniae]
MAGASAPSPSSASDSPLPQSINVPLLQDYTPPTTPAPGPHDDKATPSSLHPSPPSRSSVFVVLALLLLLISLAVLPSSSPVFDSLRDLVRPSHSRNALSTWFHAAPSHPLDPSSIFTQNASSDHTVTALFVHGLGGSEWDAQTFVKLLANRYPWVKWVSPSADFIDVTTFDDLYYHEDIAGYAHSQQQLNQLIEEERRVLVEQGKPPRIVMMGFSQGGVMTLLSALTARHPDDFEAMIALSAYLPMIHDVPKFAALSARSLPILWSHGAADPYLTLAHAEEGVEVLRSEEVGLEKLSFRSYEGLGHAWSWKELEELADWFGEHVPQYRSSTSSSSPPPSTLSSSASPPPAPPSPSDADAAPFDPDAAAPGSDPTVDPPAAVGEGETEAVEPEKPTAAGAEKEVEDRSAAAEAVTH